MKADITINSIAGQVSGVPFTYSGTVAYRPTLSYSDDGATYTALASGAASPFGTSTWQTTHPGLPAVSGATIEVKDNTTGDVMTSNVFSVVGHMITPHAPSGAIAGQNDTFTGSVSGYASAPPLQYRFDAGAYSTLSGVTVSGWSTSIAMPAASGAHTLTVTDGQVSGSVGFSVAHRPESITPATPTGTVAGTAFQFTGSFAGYDTTPPLFYSIDGSTAASLPGVTSTGWSTSLVPPTSGSHTIVVSDASGVSGSVTFTTAAAAPTGIAVFWDSAHKSSTIALTNGNTTATTSTAVAQSVLANVPVPVSGFVAFEVDITAITADFAFGLANQSFDLAVHAGLGGDANGIGLYVDNPTQAAYYAGAFLNGGTAASANGGIASIIVHGEQLWWSTEAMRATTGVKYNNSTTADPASLTGGISFAGLGSPRFPIFNCLEGGASATINGGASGFSSFLTTYMAAHSGITALAGVVASGVSGVSGVPSMTVNTPSGVVAGTAFPFTGSLAHFATAPSLAYRLDGGTATALPGVTASGWSTSLSVFTSGSHTISVSGGGVSGSVTFTAAASGVVSGTVSPDRTVLVAPTSGTITDASGNYWGISGGQVTVNGVVDTHSGNVTELAWVSGSIWQENTSGFWWYKTNPTDTWAPPTGTTINPLASGSTGGGGNPGGGGNAGNRVVGPLPGPVAPGTWLTNLRLNVPAMPNGFAQYNVLLPAQWDPTKTYALLHVGHPNDSGMDGGVYPREGLNFVTGNGFANGTASIDSVVNSVEFRRDFPAIVFAFQVDQSLDTSGAGSNANGGGYNDSMNSGGNEQGLNAVFAALLAEYPNIDPNGRLLAGYSLGGIQTLAELDDNNQFNGPSGLNIWTAGITYSDQLYRPATPNSAVFARMASVPLLCISTTSDNSPTSFDRPMYDYCVGNTGAGTPHPYPTPGTYAAGGVDACRAGSTQYHYVDDGGNNPSTYFPLDSQGGTGTAAWTWLFSQVGPGGTSGIGTSGIGTSGIPSASGSFITAPTSGVLTDASGNAWGISATGQVTVNGTADTTTANVVELAYVNNLIWQTASGLWWSKSSPSAAWLPATGTTINPLTNSGGGGGAVSGAFHVSNGQVIHPNGSVFTARGINVTQDSLSEAASNSQAQPMTTLFPGLNFVRLACHSYVSVASIQSFVETVTALGIVVLIENHQNFNAAGQQNGTAGGGQGVILTGSALATESAWYAGMAAAFADNPYVWFGSNNEPSVVDPNTGQNNVPLLSTWHLATYNAIRNTGNSAPICFDLNWITTFGVNGGMTASVYAQMTNVLWDLHFYSVVANYSADRTTLEQALQSCLDSLGTITSIDGVIPTISAEYGNSTSGATIDAGGTVDCQVIQAASDNHTVVGCAAWIWDYFGTVGDQLRVGDTNTLSAFGQQVAGWIASGT